jgi:hypothetical protein
MALAWANIEDALHAWVAEATGLPVIWADQNAPQPSSDFCTMRIRSFKKLGLTDAVVRFYHSEPEADADTPLEYKSQGIREFTLAVNALTRRTNRTTSATVVLSNLQASADMPSTTARLKAVGLVLVDCNDVLNLSGLLETDIQGRALLEIRFRVTDSLSEWVGIIERVELHPPAGWVPPDSVLFIDGSD